ncbi:hypothetical protein JM18_004137 [Phytophthora kernoviae]|uniref:Uncharacterized protein n=2 Tax=Phytophthora kernoviae TaxID=325452 RepID=A0A8T0LZ91_9STRA|nr:hypothetical protein G195_005368 [Phytophthora kernoviae 00238/432]KAG2525236.1 hypothetical protein JM16_004561 [Phytophthora kernoviae]KAG2526840.1 hypothetical protein JM18_004137 [Phytophthora kernoviae]
MWSPIQPQVHTHRAHQDPYGREASRLPSTNVRQEVRHVQQPLAAYASARAAPSCPMLPEGLHAHLPQRYSAREASKATRCATCASLSDHGLQ